MAIIQNELSFSSSPPWATIIEATETGRNGSSVTFKIQIKLKLNRATSSAFYGYAVNWRATLNGTSSGLLKVKGTERWYGGEAYRTFSTTITTSASVSGGTLPLRIEVLASGGGNVHFDKTYTVSYSTWNTPPAMGGSLGLNLGGVIPENTPTIVLSWNTASDSNGNVSGYQIYRYVNGSHNATYEVHGAGTTSYSDNISAFGQGTSIYYKIWAKDSYGEWSNALTSSTVTKNTLTGATLNSTTNIEYGSKLISFSYGGAQNTNGNGSFNYRLESSNVTVHNGSNITGTPFNLTIWRTGESVPSTPYIKFDDIKNFVSGGSNWTRSMSFVLKTSNAYGTTASSTKTLNVDLKTDPVAPSNVSVTGKVVLGDDREYYIPSQKDITVSWSGASDKLGGSLTYDIQGKLENGNYTTLKSDVNGTSTIISLDTPTTESNYIFRVIAKTGYGRTAYKDASVIQLHYYQVPTVEFLDLVRTAEGFSVKVVTKLNTSIPSVSFTKRAYSGVTSGALTTSPQLVNSTGLDSGSKYTLSVNILDNTGLSDEVTKSLDIPTYVPIMSVREKGVGINTIPDGSAKLMVSGGVSITGDTSVKGQLTVNGKVIGEERQTDILDLDVEKGEFGGDIDNFHPTKLWTTRTNNTSPNRPANYCTVFNMGAEINSNFQIASSYSQTPAFFVRGRNDSTRQYHPWARVYTDIDRPTANDVKALSVYGGELAGTVTSWRPQNQYESCMRFQTQGDGNQAGDGKTHVGYVDNGKINHYFRGQGTFYVDNYGGLQATFGNVYSGTPNDGNWHGFVSCRNINGSGKAGSYGVSGTQVKLSSSSNEYFDSSTIMELAFHGGNVIARLDLTEKSFQPYADNYIHCGTSRNRWSAVYASTGTVYSSSKDEKKDITPVSNPLVQPYGLVNPQKDLIIEGIKNTPIYSYKYRKLNNDDTFVGFLGQELEESNKQFFDLIGSSYETEEGSTQYDIREASVVGVLWTGLQDALNTIDVLKQEIAELKANITK